MHYARGGPQGPPLSHAAGPRVNAPLAPPALPDSHRALTARNRRGVARFTPGGHADAQTGCCPAQCAMHVNLAMRARRLGSLRSTPMAGRRQGCVTGGPRTLPRASLDLGSACACGSTNGPTTGGLRARRPPNVPFVGRDVIVGARSAPEALFGYLRWTTGDPGCTWASGGNVGLPEG